MYDGSRPKHVGCLHSSNPPIPYIFMYTMRAFDLQKYRLIHYLQRNGIKIYILDLISPINERVLAIIAKTLSYFPLHTTVKVFC